MLNFWRTVYIAKTKSWNDQPSVSNFTRRKGKAEMPRLCAAKAHVISNLGMHIVNHIVWKRYRHASGVEDRVVVVLPKHESRDRKC